MMGGIAARTAAKAVSTAAATAGDVTLSWTTRKPVKLRTAKVMRTPAVYGCTEIRLDRFPDKDEARGSSRQAPAISGPGRVVRRSKTFVYETMARLKDATAAWPTMKPVLSDHTPRGNPFNKLPILALAPRSSAT
jgi:hypothetical protein